MSWIKEQWNTIKSKWKDFWNGRTFFNELLAESHDIVEGIKTFTGPNATLTKITDATSIGWDDAVVKTIHSAASNTLPYSKVAVDVNSCLDERKTDWEQVQCIIDKVKEHSDSDKADFYLKIGAAILRQLVFDAKGVWITKDKAESMLQVEHDKAKEVKKILNKE